MKNSTNQSDSSLFTKKHLVSANPVQAENYWFQRESPIQSKQAGQRIFSIVYRYQLLFFLVLVMIFFLFAEILYQFENWREFQKHRGLFLHLQSQYEEVIFGLYDKNKEPFPNYDAKIRQAEQRILKKAEEVVRKIEEGGELEEIDLDLAKNSCLLVARGQKIQIAKGNLFEDIFGEKWQKRFFMGLKHGGSYFSAVISIFYPYPLSLEEFNKTSGHFQMLFKNKNFFSRYYLQIGEWHILMLTHLDPLEKKDFSRELIQGFSRNYPQIKEIPGGFFWNGVLNLEGKNPFSWYGVQVSRSQWLFANPKLVFLWILFSLFLFFKGGYRIIAMRFAFRFLMIFFFLIFTLFIIQSTLREQRVQSSGIYLENYRESTVKKQFQELDFAYREWKEKEAEKLFSSREYRETYPSLQAIFFQKNQVSLENAKKDPFISHVLFEMGIHLIAFHKTRFGHLFHGKDEGVREKAKRHYQINLPPLLNPMMKSLVQTTSRNYRSQGLFKEFLEHGDQGKVVWWRGMEKPLYFLFKSDSASENFQILRIPAQDLEKRFFENLPARTFDFPLVLVNFAGNVIFRAGSVPLRELEVQNVLNVFFSARVFNPSIHLQNREWNAWIYESLEFKDSHWLALLPVIFDTSSRWSMFLDWFLFLLVLLFLEWISKILLKPVSHFKDSLVRIREGYQEIPFWQFHDESQELFAGIRQMMLEFVRTDSALPVVPQEILQIFSNEKRREEGILTQVFLMDFYFDQDVDLNFLESLSQKYLGVILCQEKRRIRILFIRELNPGYLESGIQTAIHILKRYAQLRVFARETESRLWLDFSPIRTEICHECKPFFAPMRKEGIYVDSLTAKKLQISFDIEKTQDFGVFLVNVQG